MTKKKLTFWACDYSNKSGEGNLAKKFINENYKNKTIKIKTSKSKNIFSHKYILPYIGIVKCWKYYFKGYRIGYLNYLPLWNFLIFLLLPPKTVLGPITGGALYDKTNKVNYLVRRICFPIFYKFSELIINFRFSKKIIFSTKLLEKHLSKKTIQRSEFNFVLKNFKFKKKRKIKDIDFLIYYRIHNNKSLLFKNDFIKNLVKQNLRIFVVGNKLHLKGVKNLGYQNKRKLNNLQSRSKYTLCTSENIYSLFVIECISHHVKILIDKDYMKDIKFYKKFFILINKSKFNFPKFKF